MRRAAPVRAASPSVSSAQTSYDCSGLQAQVKSVHGALLGDALQPSPGTIASGAHTLVLTSVREPIELTLRSLDYVLCKRCDH